MTSHTNERHPAAPFRSGTLSDHQTLKVGVILILQEVQDLALNASGVETMLFQQLKSGSRLTEDVISPDLAHGNRVRGQSSQNGIPEATND